MLSKCCNAEIIEDLEPDTAETVRTCAHCGEDVLDEVAAAAAAAPPPRDTRKLIRILTGDPPPAGTQILILRGYGSGRVQVGERIADGEWSPTIERTDPQRWYARRGGEGD